MQPAQRQRSPVLQHLFNSSILTGHVVRGDFDYLRDDIWHVVRCNNAELKKTSSKAVRQLRDGHFNNFETIFEYTYNAYTCNMNDMSLNSTRQRRAVFSLPLSRAWQRRGVLSFETVQFCDIFRIRKKYQTIMGEFNLVIIPSKLFVRFSKVLRKKRNADAIMKTNFNCAYNVRIR